MITIIETNQLKMNKAGRQVGWLAIWLIGWSVDWLVGRLIGWLVGWFVGWLVQHLTASPKIFPEEQELLMNPRYCFQM